MKVCAETGCGAKIPAGRPRCARHSRRPWHDRPSRQSRGYDGTYERARRALLEAQPEPRFCWLCGLPIAARDLEVDHRVPLAEGGSNDVSNLALAHRWCNQARVRKSCARRTA